MIGVVDRVYCYFGWGVGGRGCRVGLNYEESFMVLRFGRL